MWVGAAWSGGEELKGFAVVCDHAGSIGTEWYLLVWVDAYSRCCWRVWVRLDVDCRRAACAWERARRIAWHGSGSLVRGKAGFRLGAVFPAWIPAGPRPEMPERDTGSKPQTVVMSAPGISSAISSVTHPCVSKVTQFDQPAKMDFNGINFDPRWL